jgi:hypothetical protein
MLVLVLGLPARGADVRAKTEDGKDVILHDDGTWTYAEFAKKDKRASERYVGKHGTFALSMVPGVWKKSEKPSNPVAEAEFTHKEGDAMAMVIAERIAVPPAQLKQTVVQNIRNADPQAKILKEEKKTVNGTDVQFLTLNAKVQGIPFTYMYCLYTGDAGTIQIMTFTGQNLFNEYKQDMEAMLNGFEVIKK